MLLDFGPILRVLFTKIWNSDKADGYGSLDGYH